MTVTNPKLLEFQKLWADRSTREQARTYARAYVNQFRAQLEAKYKDLPIDALVPTLSAYRSAGRDEDVVILDMWLQSEFPIQHVDVQLGINSIPVPLSPAQQALLAEAEAIVASRNSEQKSEEA